MRVHWLAGVSAPGTPSRLDRVGVLQIGSARARNNRASTYAHNDPNGAYPHNAFVSGLVPFLQRVAAAR